MTVPRICVRLLTFLGPTRPPATLKFGPGLNVIYGGSDTGKSFVVDAIDFMLGGKGPLRDIPERVGYDRVLLGLMASDGQSFTLVRAAEGGPFKLFAGLHDVIPEDQEAIELSEQHSDRREDNLSTYLLAKLDLEKRRIKKNKRGEVQSLSFRNLARLVVVNEEEIIQQRSPLSDGNYVADTANTSAFKLLLTGVDDSALGTAKLTTPEQHSKEGQVELLDDLIRDQRAQIRATGTKPEQLEEQLLKLDDSMTREGEQLAFTEREFRKLTERRRELLSKAEAASTRIAEIRVLLDRFSLLDTHYKSDIARLSGMSEAGSLFDALGKSRCPLCGAAPEHHRARESCDGDIEAVVAAAAAEAKKTSARRGELHATIVSLQKEANGFERRLPQFESQLATLNRTIDAQTAPVRRMRASFKQLAEKSAKVQGTLSLYGTLKDLEDRLAKLREDDNEQDAATNADVELSTTTVDKFAKVVQTVLSAWELPNSDRVHFDLRTRDLVINGKARTSHGKGMRAITQAAFTVGLLEYCFAHDTPHPGFVVVDSPLLSYREPESVQDDMRETNVDTRFFEHLAGLPDNRQVIVIENRDPPSAIQKGEFATRFTGTLGVGRSGFFPEVAETNDASPEEADA